MRISDWSSDVCSSDLKSVCSQSSTCAPYLYSGGCVRKSDGTYAAWACLRFQWDIMPLNDQDAAVSLAASMSAIPPSRSVFLPDAASKPFRIIRKPGRDPSVHYQS